jgi:LmbE family N-acetylglucosaminyl deacetylase
MQVEKYRVQQRTMLAVFAHPDDESFGPGGTLAKYCAEGVEVWLACATDGDAGTVDSAAMGSYATTAQLRAAELCCAAQALGLKGIDFYAYRDSGMAGSPDNQNPKSLFQAPMEEVVGKIVASIRQHRPQVVLCDNEHGGYGHPDHIKLHQATVRAFAAAGDPELYKAAGPPHAPEHLYFTAFTPGLLKWLVRFMPLVGRDPRHFGRNSDIDLLQIMQWETPANARIDVRHYLDTKMRASACHHSQAGPTESFGGLPGFILRRVFGTETFVQGYPVPKDGASGCADLFACR